MSRESAAAFRDKVNQSEELQEEVRTALASGKPGDVVALGARQGHQFTVEEIAELVKSANEQGELSDFELELVSAGGQVCS